MQNNQLSMVTLSGGLGNQMFQYAFGRALSLRQNKPISYDISWFEEAKYNPEVTFRQYELDVFKLQCLMARAEDLKKLAKNKWWQKGNYKNVIKEKKHNLYDAKLLELNGTHLYKGYFQSEKYFQDIRPQIVADFSLREEMNLRNRQMLEKIKNVNAISLHVRRGDYLKNINLGVHGLCDLDYYAKAIAYLAAKIENPHFYLFSDDIQWVVENLKLDYPYTVVDINGSETAYCDIELMKNCQHNIVANSSFSWWGAWLNENPQKIVIAPQRWTVEDVKNDIVPESWVRL